MEVDKNDYSKEGITMLNIASLYCINKIMDLLDTVCYKILYFKLKSHLTSLFHQVFFILRKKYNQISFLHTYHHIAMVLGCYVCGKFFSGGGHLFPLGIINAYVHVLMVC